MADRPIPAEQVCIRAATEQAFPKYRPPLHRYNDIPCITPRAARPDGTDLQAASFPAILPRDGTSARTAWRLSEIPGTAGHGKWQGGDPLYWGYLGLTASSLRQPFSSRRLALGPRPSAE